MIDSWRSLLDELARWADAGHTADFWWRDDDATAPTAPVLRLLALSNATRVPLALAVIPHDAQAGLLGANDAWVTLLQHGVAHRNLAQPGDKKTEFPAVEPTSEALGRLAHGRARLAVLFGHRALPVLVPPWNRISAPGLLRDLPAAGYRGLSRFGPRKASGGRAGLVQVNTHVDVIDWNGTRGFVGVDAALAQAVAHLQARRLGQVDRQEATGWLTHHAVHDAATWGFLEQLFERTADARLAVWRSAGELFVAP